MSDQDAAPSDIVKLQTALLKLAEAGNLAVHLDGLFVCIHQVVGEAIPSSTFAIALQDPGSQDIRLAYFAGDDALPPQMHVGAMEILNYVFREDQPVMGAALDMVAQMTGQPPEIEQMQDFKGFLSAPLRTLAGKMFGVIALHRKGENWSAYTEQDQQLLRILSIQAASLIERYNTDSVLREAQRALQESEKRLRTVVSNTPVVLYAIDTQGVFQLSEGQGLQVLGLTPGQVVGSSLYDVYGASPEIIAAYQQALTGKTVQRVVQVGELIFNASYAPIVEPDGQISGVIGVAANITDMMHSQARQAALYRGVQQMGASLDVQQVAVAIHRSVAEIMRVDAVVMALLDEANQEVEYVYLYDDCRLWPNERLPLGQGLASYIIQTGETLITDDINNYELVNITGALDFGTQPTDPLALLAVPMRLRDRVIGMISIQAYYPNHYTPDDRELLQMLAAYAAPAFENARLYAEAQRRSEQMRAVYQAGLEISASLELGPVLRSIYRQCLAIAALDRFLVGLYNEKTGDFDFPLAIEHGRTVRPRVSQHRQRLDLMRAVVLRRKTIYHSEMTVATSRRGRLNSGTADGAVSFLGVPLFTQQQVTGVLVVQRDQAGAFSPDQVQMIEAISTQAAVSIENARLFGELQRMAITDSLTGVFTRRHAFFLAEHEFKRSRRYHKLLSLIIFDIDRFRKFNDKYGHPVGDQVLCAAIKACQLDLRQPDIFGRFGGEEFLIVLPESSLDQALVVAERLRSRVADTKVWTNAGVVNITISLGVATLTPEDVNFESMVQRADQALYRSKNTGRNRVSS